MENSKLSEKMDRYQYLNNLLKNNASKLDIGIIPAIQLSNGIIVMDYPYMIYPDKEKMGI